MRNWLYALKPAAPARAHLMLGATLWTVVGSFLLIFGVLWAWDAQLVLARPLLVLAVAAGIFKEHFVLRRTATRMIDRIRARGDGRCLGGFLSVKSWGFVVFMIVVGRLIRGSPAPRVIVGLVYVAVGTALLLGARRLWTAWYQDAPRA